MAAAPGGGNGGGFVEDHAAAVIGIDGAVAGEAPAEQEIDIGLVGDAAPAAVLELRLDDAGVGGVAIVHHHDAVRGE